LPNAYERAGVAAEPPLMHFEAEPRNEQRMAGDGRTLRAADSSMLEEILNDE